jgi:hypothetical protein
MALVCSPPSPWEFLANCVAQCRFSCWSTVGVPQVHHFGQEGLHNVLAIDLLGPNLEDLFDMCGRKFSIKTVCLAAKQMVSCHILMADPLDRRTFDLYSELFSPVLDFPNSIRP